MEDIKAKLDASRLAAILAECEAASAKKSK